MWLFGLANKIIADPFLAGRLVSVFISLTTFWGLYFLAKKLLPYPFYFLPSFLYTLTPFFVFFDRQALMETSLTAAGILSFLFFEAYWSKKQIWLLIFLSVTLGLALLIKSSAFFFLLLSLSGFLFQLFRVKKTAEKLSVLWSLIGLIVIVFLILLPLIIQPDFKIIFTRADRFNLTLQELKKLPFNHWFNNFFNLTAISFWQLTPPVFLLSVFGCWLAFKKRLNYLLFWFFGGLFLIVISARGLTPRYVVAFLPLICLLSSFTLFAFFTKNRWLCFITTSFLLIPFLLTCLLLFQPLNYFKLMHFFTANYSQKSDYVTGETAGYGLNSVFAYLEEKAKKGPILVGVRLDAGNPENAVMAYFFQHPKIKTFFLDRQLLKPDFDLASFRWPLPVYFVSRSQHQAGLESYLKEEIKFYKPEGKTYFGIYHLKGSITEKLTRFLFKLNSYKR